MRIPAKALPCLLCCLACVTVMPSAASEFPMASAGHATTAPLPDADGRAALLQHHLRFDEARQVAARRRAKAHHAAPKAVAVPTPPHDASNRFLMTQNGRKMSAEDFDAWMKARGIRVAKGAPEPAKSAD